MATRLGIGDLAGRTLPLEEGVATLQHALSYGLNLVDTAPGYPMLAVCSSSEHASTAARWRSDRVTYGSALSGMCDIE
jgi:aryl-alcohol dehydrogenase-like predicted oxidoreductase